MDNKIKFKKCLIDSEKKIISILFYNDDNASINIDVSSEKNNEDILQLIDIANVYYSAQIHKLNQSEKYDSYGCLTSKVLGLDDIPITFINPKYVKNLFLQLLQLLFQDDESYLKYCQRDENSLEIPTSQNNISILINDIVNICNNNNNNIDNEEDINIIDIKDVFIMILNYITSIQNNKIQKKLQKGKLQKQMNICGGIHNLQDIKNSLKDNINESLIHTGKNIHKLIYEYKNILYEGKNLKNNLDYIKTCVDQNPNVCLYENTEITFKFMMETIQNIFNTLFVQILPQTSMLNCLYATLYQASVLNEMNILKHYSKTIQIPLLYRLIYSFFKDQTQVKMVNNDEDNIIYKLVNRLSNEKEKNLDILCEIALKMNIKNVEQINLLYWLLNERRGYTYEFYLIIIVNLYTLGKCQNMNRNNKFSNGKTFAEPLYNLMLTFYGFVINDLKDIKIALCSETLDQFNTIYSSEINKCLKLFVQNLQK